MATYARNPASFVDDVRRAGARATKFGPYKAFISSVYDHMDARSRPATLAEFKRQLLDASSRGEIQLSRADLVGAMDPALVRASEIVQRGPGGFGDASFHFVDLQAAPVRTTARARPAQRPPMSRAPSRPHPSTGTFAATVRDAAAHATKFGPYKAFISSVYDHMDASSRPATLAEFKRQLLDASSRGEIQLSRADLVGAMDPELVRASEIVQRGPGGIGDASFHFVDIARRNPARGDAEFLSLLKEHLFDPDPDSVLFAQDLMLEHGWSLPKVGAAIDNSYGNDHGDSIGAFPVTDGHFLSPTNIESHGYEGVTWFVGKMQRARDPYFWYLSISARGDSFEYTTGLRYPTEDLAIHMAALCAWRVVVLLKRHRSEPNFGLVQDLITRHVNEVDVPDELLNDATEVPLTPNPAWTTNALADSFEALARLIPPQWMPRLSDVRGGPRNTVVAEFKEHGCGVYGCVLPTNDDGVVLKVTTDSTEAEFASQLAADLVAPICVEYYTAAELAAVHKGRKVYALWREAADDVGKVGDVAGDDAAEAVAEQHLCARMVFEAYVKKRPAPYVASLLTQWLDAVHAMELIPELATLASGIRRVWEEQRVFFGDIHEGNLGRVFRGLEIGQWVITDPGHVAVIR